MSWGAGTDVEHQLQQYVDDLAADPTSALEPATQADGAAAQAGSRMGQQDALAIAQNGGHDVSEEELDGNADDDGLDDDMMDKISSSPSIEDGGYTLQPALLCSPSQRPPPGSSPASVPPSGDARSSSLYTDSPKHLPLAGQPCAGDQDHDRHRRCVPGEPARRPPAYLASITHLDDYDNPTVTEQGQETQEGHLALLTAPGSADEVGNGV